MWKFPLDMPLMMLMGASSREQMCCWEKGKAIEECIHIEHFYDVSKGKKEEREEKRRKSFVLKSPIFFMGNLHERKELCSTPLDLSCPPSRILPCSVKEQCR